MKRISLFKKYFFLFLYRAIAIYLPGGNSILGKKIGKKLRYLCCRNIFKYCGSNVNIEKGAIFGTGFNLIIGDNSGLGLNCNVPNDIVIGRNVIMGPNVYIFGIHTHNVNSIDVPMCEQGMITKGKVKIEDDVWIGRQVIINYERVISEGTIIAAGSVVTKNFESFSIIGGNPAKLIRSRIVLRNDIYE